MVRLLHDVRSAGARRLLLAALVLLAALALLAALSVGTGCRRESAPARSLRLVSLTPSATELLATLGLAEQLVGVDEYSKFPASVAALPKVGSFLAPNLEAIVALRPSHVVADDVHTETAATLRDAGIATVILPMHSLTDVRAALTTVGTTFDRSAQAATALRAIDDEIDAAQRTRVRPAPRVLVVLDREAGGLGNLVCAATGSWIDQLLAIVGADNVLAASGVRYPKVSLEEVIKANPDVILDLSFAGDARRAWSAVDVAAVRAGRVLAENAPYLISPSPRVPEALATLRKLLAAAP